MGDTGLERKSITKCNTNGLRNVRQGGGAGSGAVGAVTGENTPDLHRVIDAWPTLPGAVKVGIVAMVEAARGDQA